MKILIEFHIYGRVKDETLLFPLFFFPFYFLIVSILLTAIYIISIKRSLKAFSSSLVKYPLVKDVANCLSQYSMIPDLSLVSMISTVAVVIKKISSSRITRSHGSSF